MPGGTLLRAEAADERNPQMTLSAPLNRRLHRKSQNLHRWKAGEQTFQKIQSRKVDVSQGRRKASRSGQVRFFPGHTRSLHGDQYT